MDKLLEVADQQASPAVSTTSVADLDENLFQQFMGKNPFGTFIVFQGIIIYVKVTQAKNNLFYNIIIKWKWVSNYIICSLLLSSKVFYNMSL